jgi:hypothetical protein
MNRLYVSNKDRFLGSAFDFYIPDLVGLFSNQGTFKASIVQVSFENFAETVIFDQNDEFFFRIIDANGNTVYNIFVSFNAGTYPISGSDSILSAIQTAQDSVAVNLFTWDYNTNTKRIEITTGSAGANLRIQVDKNNDPRFPNQETTSQLRWIDALGISNWVVPQSSTAGAVGTLDMGDNTVDISTSSFMDIVLNIPTMTFSTDSVHKMIACRVPVNAGYGELVSYEPIRPFEFMIDGSHLENLRITCYNQWSQYYILPSTANVSIVFSLEPAHT